MNGYAVKGYSGHSINWTTGPGLAARDGGATNLKFDLTSANFSGISITQTLTQLLNTYEEPVIVGVNLKLTETKSGQFKYVPKHFVLVTGKIGDQFTINDPGNSSNHYLSAYNNNFQIRGFYKDPPDLSALSFAVVAPSPVDLLVTNGNKQQTGIDPNTDNIIENIPQSVTFSDAPEDSVDSTSSTETVTFVTINQPVTGNYTLTIGGATGEPYTIYASPIATDGSLSNQTLFSGTVTPGSVSTYTFAYKSQPVPAPPVVLDDPESQIATAGDSVSFFAAASGDPTPTVQWQVSTDSGSTFTNIAGATSTTLTLTPTSDQNDNEYRAVFTNSKGSATTTPATLTVNSQPSGLVISSDTGVFPQFNLGGSAGQVVPLSTGNIVTARTDGVYLVNGQTGALISTLTEKGNDSWVITALTNGNFVVSNQSWNNGVGAVTWGSGITGVNSPISAANSLIGISQGGAGGLVTPLAKGNYVVSNDQWHGGYGAVTLGNGTTGTTGIVSAANSLVGSTIYDLVGGSGHGGVTALAAR